MIPNAPSDGLPPKPKPGEESEHFEPGSDIGPWRILLPMVALVLVDAFLIASTASVIRLPSSMQMVNDPPMLAAIFASQSLLAAMMYQGSAATIVRSLRKSLSQPSRFAVWGLLGLSGTLVLLPLIAMPTLGMAMAGGVFVGLSLDLLGFGLRPYEDIPAISRRFSLKALFIGTALVAVLLVGYQFSIAEIDQGNINVLRITVALFLTLATLGLAALATMWSWPTWLASASIATLAIPLLAQHNDKVGLVGAVPTFALAISAANALPLLLAGWRVYRKPYYG